MLCRLTIEQLLVFGLEHPYLPLDDESVTTSNGKVSVVAESISILKFDTIIDHVYYNIVAITFLTELLYIHRLY